MESCRARDPYWDIVKAVLIYLVILGHVLAAYPLNKDIPFWADSLYRMIYEFHMPCFMVVSGYFAAKSIASLGSPSVRRYASRLLLPLIGFATFQFTFIVDYGSLRPIRIYGAFFDLWFLPVMFECVVAYYVMMIKRNCWWRMSAFFTILLASMLVADVPYLNLLWVYNAKFSFMWPFFVMGAILRWGEVLKSPILAYLKTYQMGGVSLAGYLLLFWFVPLCPYGWCGFEEMANNCLNLLMGLFGAIAFLSAMKAIAPFFSRCPCVLKIGRATLGIYILQFMYFAFPLPSCFVLPFGHDYASFIVLSLAITLLMWGIYLLTRNIMIFRLFLYGEAREK